MCENTLQIMRNVRQSVFVVWIFIVQLGYIQCQECQNTGNPGYDVDECIRDTPCIRNTVIPSPGSCDKYWVCSSGIWYEQPCPTSMGFSNVTYQCCVGVDRSECSAECAPTSPTPEPPHELCDSTPPGCVESEKVPDRNHCDYYFECVLGAWMSLPCALGQAFDPVSLACIEDVAEANCEYRCLTSAAPTTLAPTVPLTTTEARTFVTVIETAAVTSDTEITAPWGLNGTEIFATEILNYTTEMTPASTASTTPSSTVTPSTVTTTKWSSTSTTIHESTESNAPDQDNTQMIIIIGSVCGAVGAILLVVLAILAQSGVIRCDIKESSPAPNLPDGVMGPRYFPSSKGSTVSFPAFGHVSGYSNSGYHRHSVFDDNKAALFGFSHVDVISEKSAEYALDSMKSQKTRTTGSRTTGSRTPGTRTPGNKTPGMRTPGGKTPDSVTPRPDDARDSSGHEGHRGYKKKRQSQSEKFADEITKTLALYDVVSVCSEASSDQDSAYEESIPTPRGPIMPIAGTIDV